MGKAGDDIHAAGTSITFPHAVLDTPGIAKISEEPEVHAKRLSTRTQRCLRTDNVTRGSIETLKTGLTGTNARFCLPMPPKSILFNIENHAEDASCKAGAA